MTEAQRPLTILIAALGGEGGGVLMNWIVGAARQQGLPVQATSVPGVAQRTGSTSYYIELMTRPLPAGVQPVFALVPMPGRVDVAIASEAVEAGRLMERGFLSPQRTTLIYSASRVFTTAEKLHMADGRYDDARVDRAAEKLTKRAVRLDLEAMARAHGTMVSATMFGALAGAGVLPWEREVCEQQMGRGRAAAASLAGFQAAHAAVRATGNPQPTVRPAESAITRAPSGPVGPPDVKVQAAEAGVPDHLQSLVALGVARCTDFQDADYANLFRARVRRLVRATGNRSARPDFGHALEESTRRLALWMAYEDIARVADLKTRPERLARIRTEAQARHGDIVRVVDYLKPGAAELADMLPVSLGARLQARVARGQGLPFLGRGILLSSTSVFGHAVLRTLAQGRRIRRRSLRWAHEQRSIETWLDAMDTALGQSAAFAGALAELPRVLKGYGDTQSRGRANFQAIFERVALPAIARRDLDAAAPSLRSAIAAALADPERAALTSLLEDAAPRAIVTQ